MKWQFSDPTYQLMKDNNPEDKGNKQGEPYDCPNLLPGESKTTVQAGETDRDWWTVRVVDTELRV